MVAATLGVTAVTLCWQSGAEPDAPVLRAELTPPTERSARFQHDWSMAMLDLKAGDRLSYWLELRDDGRHAAAAPWPTTRPRKLTLVTEAELTRMLKEKLEQSMNRLTQLRSEQHESTDALVRLTAALPDTPAQEVADRARSEKWRQDRLAHTAAQLAERIAQIADDHEISRLGAAERIAGLRATSQRLTAIAEARMPAVIQSLDEAVQHMGGATSRPAQEPVP
jgi:hypothetical protein